jgi:predicted nuclease of predicted toxin-antitoxin system
MRRVLIDECLPVQLHRWLAPPDARTVEFQGWKGLRNGELLAQATERFDVLLTVDALLADEHDFAALGLGVVLLSTNRIKKVADCFRRSAPLWPRSRPAPSGSAGL